jgi:hypothetical protein
MSPFKLPLPFALFTFMPHDAARSLSGAGFVSTTKRAVVHPTLRTRWIRIKSSSCRSHFCVCIQGNLPKQNSALSPLPFHTSRYLIHSTALPHRRIRPIELNLHPRPLFFNFNCPPWSSTVYNLPQRHFYSLVLSFYKGVYHHFITHHQWNANQRLPLRNSQPNP